MKIGIIADPHSSSEPITCGKRYNSLSLGKIKKAYADFAEAGCEIVILLGDITDTEPTHEMEIEALRKVASVFAEYSAVKTVCLMGNHDAFVFTPDEFYSIIGEAYRPATLNAGDTSLVFIDACYYADGTHYAPGGYDWEDTFYPHTADLENEMASAGEKVIIFMHQDIDPNIPEDHRLSNAAEIRGILEKSGKVAAVYQGHYHPGKSSVVNGISYTALPAMCEGEDTCLVIEI